MTDPSSVEPRDAATVVLLRPSAVPSGVPQVLLLGRPASAKFAPGTQVFPGGSVDPADGDPRWTNNFEGELARVSDRRLFPALMIAAVRETYEECGVLLARDRDGSWCDPDQLAALEPMRARIRAGQAHLFRTELTAAGLRPALASLVFCAHWITPEGLPRRFDTRFFMAALPPTQSPAPDPLGEHISLRWVSPAQALDEAHQGVCQLLPPTRAVLAAVAAARSVADALELAAASPVETFQPRLAEVTTARYPGLDTSQLRKPL